MYIYQDDYENTYQHEMKSDAHLLSPCRFGAATAKLRRSAMLLLPSPQVGAATSDDWYNETEILPLWWQYEWQHWALNGALVEARAMRFHLWFDSRNKFSLSTVPVLKPMVMAFALAAVVATDV